MTWPRFISPHSPWLGLGGEIFLGKTIKYFYYFIIYQKYFFIKIIKLYVVHSAIKMIFFFIIDG